jgi:hypothetical protein
MATSNRAGNYTSLTDVTVQGKGVPISDQAEQLIIGLDRQHKDHSLRYSFLMEDAAPIFTPPPQELLSLLEELLMAGRISTHRV